MAELTVIPGGDMEQEQREEQKPAMTESEVLRAIDQEIRWADDLLRDDISANRKKAWDYFEGKSPKTFDEDVDEYFQTIVSKDVADVIESTLAEILPAFATDRPATFDAEGEGDEEQSLVESDICNDVLMEAGNGFVELSTAAKNALLLRIGALEVIWDDALDVEHENLDNVPPIGLALLIRQQEIERIQEQLGQIDHPPLEIAEVEREDRGGLSVQIKRFVRKAKCRIEAVPVDEILISSDSVSLDLDRTRFVARQTLASRSDLIAEGYDESIVNSLTAYTTTTQSRSRSARERDTWGREKHSGDRATDLVKIVRAYYRIDEDRDGIAEQRRIVVAGSPGGWRMLEDEPVSYQPFAAGAGYIWPHMPYGLSIYDKLRHVQDLKTKFWRIMLEAGQRTARDFLHVPPGFDIDSILSQRFGGVVQGPGEVRAIQSQRFPTELASLQQFADKARREGGGGAVDKSARENIPVEAGAHGVERFMSAVEELNAMVARFLAETLVRQAYVKIHTTLRLYGEPIPKIVDGQWTMIDPRQWRPRTKVSVATGLTLSERQRLAAAYGVIVERQTALIENGSILANQEVLHRALQDQARMMGIQNPQSYYVDPQSQEGQQAAMQAQQAAMQQAREAQQQAAVQAQLQAQVLGTVEQIKQQGALQKQAMQSQADMMKLAQDQQQFLLELGQKFDQLRVQVLEIEAKHGEQGEEPIRSE